MNPTTHKSDTTRRFGRTQTPSNKAGGVRTLAGLAASAAARHTGVALRHKVAGGWQGITYSQLR